MCFSAQQLNSLGNNLLNSKGSNAYAVTNHLNFYMMAETVTGFYADRIKAAPERRYIVKGRTSFAFPMCEDSLPMLLLTRIFSSFGLPHQNTGKLPAKLINNRGDAEAAEFCKQFFSTFSASPR